MTFEPRWRAHRGRCGWLFDHYGFAINLESESPERTRVTLETHYTPRNPMYGLLNKLMMRRQFRKVCAEIVGGLKTFAESRYRP
jgi:hypothetical protein